MGFDPHGYIKLPNVHMDKLIDVMKTFQHGLFQFDPDDEYVNSEHFTFLLENDYIMIKTVTPIYPETLDKINPVLTEEGEEFLSILEAHQDL